MYCPAEDEVGGKRKLEDAAIEAAKRPRTDGQPPFLPGSTHRCLFTSGYYSAWGTPTLKEWTIKLWHTSTFYLV